MNRKVIDKQSIVEVKQESEVIKRTCIFSVFAKIWN
jgi:hypothetical protein